MNKTAPYIHILKQNFCHRIQTILCHPRKFLSGILIPLFLCNTIGPIPIAQAEDFKLPLPGVMISLSPEFNPPILKGIKVHHDNPFCFDFILDRGDTPTRGHDFSRVPKPVVKQGSVEGESDPEEQTNAIELKQESTKLIKYFLASLTIPEKDLWVNLSPYEKDRIIPQSFGLTEMGRDLLGEDYMLKQITASLIYPEGETGRKFWKRIYAEAQKRYGTTNVPVNTFNKVWIVPDKAVVYENAKAGTAYVVEAKLKVMLEQDYLSLFHHVIPAKGPHTGHAQVASGIQDTSAIGSQILREIVIPELTKEVNEGKNFAQLRQVYNSLILATWYKKKIKDSILEQVYADKKKVAGVNIADPRETERIYQRYLKAFKKGVYNFIKEDPDPITQEIVPRKYFSGGIIWELDSAMVINYDAKILKRFTFSETRAEVMRVFMQVVRYVKPLKKFLSSGDLKVFDSVIQKLNKEWHVSNEDVRTLLLSDDHKINEFLERLPDGDEVNFIDANVVSSKLKSEIEYLKRSGYEIEIELLFKKLDFISNAADRISNERSIIKKFPGLSNEAPANLNEYPIDQRPLVSEIANIIATTQGDASFHWGEPFREEMTAVIVDNILKKEKNHNVILDQVVHARMKAALRLKQLDVLASRNIQEYIKFRTDQFRKYALGKEIVSNGLVNENDQAMNANDLKIAELATSQGSYKDQNIVELYRTVVADYLKIKDGIAADIGSGSNTLTAQGLSKAGLDAVMMIDNSSQLNGAEIISGSNISKHQGDALDLPLMDSSIKIISFNQSLSFIDEYFMEGEVGKILLKKYRPSLLAEFQRRMVVPEAADRMGSKIALIEAWRVLEPGGWILIKPGSHIHGMFGDSSRTGDVKHYESCLNELGFENIKIFYNKTGAPVFMIASKPKIPQVKDIAKLKADVMGKEENQVARFNEEGLEYAREVPGVTLIRVGELNTKVINPSIPEMKSGDRAMKSFVLSEDLRGQIISREKIPEVLGKLGFYRLALPLAEGIIGALRLNFDTSERAPGTMYLWKPSQVYKKSIMIAGKVCDSIVFVNAFGTAKTRQYVTSLTLVRIFDGYVIGYAFIGDNSKGIPNTKIFSMQVLPNHRNREWGDNILKEQLELSEALYHDDGFVVLQSQFAFDPIYKVSALSFYLRHGFKPYHFKFNRYQLGLIKRVLQKGKVKPTEMLSLIRKMGKTFLFYNRKQVSLLDTSSIIKSLNEDSYAMSAQRGGIDLTPANMNVQVKTGSPTETFGDDNSNGIKFHFSRAMLTQLQNAPGFVPVIINMQPLKDLDGFLGLKESSH